jgi:hypothetical protein
VAESFRTRLGNLNTVMRSGGVPYPREIDEVTPKTMADVAAELLTQNNWGEGAKIQHMR